MRPRWPGRRVADAWVALPLISLAAWVAVLAHKVPELAPVVDNSDAAGPMLIAESVGRVPPGTPVTMASEGNYSTVGLDVATRWLPHYRALWEALPFLMEIAGVALLAAVVWRLAGWRAAALTAAIAAITPLPLLTPLLLQAYHNFTFLNAVVLAALLVWQARAARPLVWWRLLVCAVVGVLTGIDLASDGLLIVVGMAPLVLAPLVVLLRHRDRTALTLTAPAIGTAVMALLSARVTIAVAHRLHVGVGQLPVALASPGRMSGNATLFRDSVLAMGNGRLDLGGVITVDTVVQLVCGVLALAAVVVPLWLLARTSVGTRRPPGGEAANAAPLGREVFIVYWGVCALLLVAGFLLSTVADDALAIRYLPPLLYAVAATVPFAVARSGALRIAAAVAVALVGLYGARQLEAVSTPAVETQQGTLPLLAALESQGLHHGYAGYWQGDLLTWQSAGRVESRAVIQAPGCQPTDPGWFCPYTRNAFGSWFAPQPGPSFLVVEDGSIFFGHPLPAALQPNRSFRVLRFTVFVFDHDIGLDAAHNAAGWPSAG